MSAQVKGLGEALNIAKIKASMAAMKAMTRAETNMKEELRSQMIAGGFSDRMAKTWRGQVYPSSGTSLNPAALVYSKAPGIVDAYARGVTIVAKAGRRLLAIPTDDAPMKGSGGRKQQNRAMTPLEVEARFGKRLRFVPATSAEGRRIGHRAVGYLIMDGVVPRKSNGRLRNASARELAGRSRNKTRPVVSAVMFVLVASVKVPKKLDLQGPLDRAAASLPQLLAEEWSE